MTLTTETINKLIGIKESYQASDALMKILFDREKREEIFKDTSYDGIQGERRVVVCRNCGELVSDFIAKYEGGGFK
ncbi:hypothetical protein A6C02_13585 [Listeria monocytogenes]|nr:hypothetical protein [Listeria monocytogenes]